MSPFVYQRTDVYGSDAEVFRPERWIEANDEERKTMEKNLLTFGSGNRVCIGKVRFASPRPPPLVLTSLEVFDCVTSSSN